ncbi:YlbF family regulator [Halorussus halophilus]|uniref:YlbF family regulator n=1 Tax=Halorussus halophilus TaxID=2650975 RepID=UPI001300D20D|nr:YlbF family regulator [Halorussus halophilus]
MSIETEADGETTNLSRLEELGSELGERIAESTEYQQFEEAKEAVENDAEAQERVKEFEQLRQEFMLARQTGEATQEDVEKVREAQEDLHELPVMAEYMEAQDELESTLEAVNEAISEPLAVDFGEQGGGCCQE